MNIWIADLVILLMSRSAVVFWVQPLIGAGLGSLAVWYIQSRYAQMQQKDLEDFKSKLATREHSKQAAAELWHRERLRAAIEISRSMADASAYVRQYVSVFAAVPPDEEAEVARRQMVEAALLEYSRSIRRHEVLLTAQVINILQNLETTLVSNYRIYTRSMTRLQTHGADMSEVTRNKLDENIERAERVAEEGIPRLESDAKQVLRIMAGLPEESQD